MSATEKTVIQLAIANLVEKQNLSKSFSRQTMESMMNGECTSAQIGSFVTALRMKGETEEEITGLVEMMREKALHVPVVGENLLDTCGTGGDGGATFNVSTASAIVAAAGGIRVAKHGNRAMSSKPTSGSMDVLEKLGVNIQLTNDQAAKCLHEIGICFMFAPLYHQSMKHVAGPRREIGVRTIFNFLGPLSNPAGADRQLLGVYDRNKTELLAGVLRQLGLTRAMVVGSEEGLDEISISSPTKITELKNGELSTYTITADDLGLRAANFSEIEGGDADINSRVILDVFAGSKGANRDIVLANAGACFYLSGKCGTLQEGVKFAGSIIDQGLATTKLNQLIQWTGALQ